MSNYTIAFQFSISGGSIPLNAVLSILDANTFSLDKGPVQIQPYNQSSTPPLSTLSVKKNGMTVSAAEVGGAQSLQVLVVVNAVAPNMSVKLSYNDVSLQAQYSILGSEVRGQLVYGNNLITFPS